ncbi:MAG: rane protein [Chloroflexota bacterium]|jgi:membrane protein|nr:rane protein [Chloroflexota bacterium]
MARVLAPLIRSGRRFVIQCVRDDVFGLAAELAYRFFLAIFPFFLFLAALGGTVVSRFGLPNPAQHFAMLLTRVMPSAAAEVFQSEIDYVIQTANPGLVSASLAGALWIATGATTALIKAMNRAFNVEETRPFWRRYLLALILTCLAGGTVVAGFLLVVGIALLGPPLAEALGRPVELSQALAVTSWLLFGLLLTLSVAVLYWAGPNIRLRWRWVLPSAAAVAVGWLVATSLFTEGMERLGTYRLTYGALAGVIALLLWFYVAACMLLLGAELAALIAAQQDPVGMRRQRRRTRAQAPVRQLPPPAEGTAVRATDVA